MMFIVALALLLAAPPPDPIGKAGAGRAAEQIASFVADQQRQRRVLVPLGQRTTELPSEIGGERTVATFLDRTGGCARGWVRLTVVATATALAPSGSVETFNGAACDVAPLPLNHLLDFVDSVAKARWKDVAEYLPGDVQFPIGSEVGSTRTRKTFDRAAVLAGAVPFPVCDPIDDAPSCEAPRDSGRVTCACRRSQRSVEVDFQLDPAVPRGRPQLVSIREKTAPPPPR